jgi:hypothetical protein
MIKGVIKMIDTKQEYELTKLDHIEETKISQATCQHCGDTGDVVTNQYYVGGQGYVPRTYCKDTVKCWERWEKLNS